MVIVLLLVGIAVLSKLNPTEHTESVKEAMRDGVLHEVNKINFLGIEVNPAVVCGQWIRQIPHFRFCGIARLICDVMSISSFCFPVAMVNSINNPRLFSLSCMFYSTAKVKKIPSRHDVDEGISSIISVCYFFLSAIAACAAARRAIGTRNGLHET